MGTEGKMLCLDPVATLALFGEGGIGGTGIGAGETEDAVCELDDRIGGKEIGVGVGGDSDGRFGLQLYGETIFAETFDEELVCGWVKLDACMGTGELTGKAETEVDSFLGGLEGVVVNGVKVGTADCYLGLTDNVFEGEGSSSEIDGTF